MAKFTLDAFREAADAKYGATEIELSDGTIVRLLNPLRLDKETRASLTDKLGGLNAEDADQEEELANIIRLVAEYKPSAEKLLEEVGGDLAVLVSVIEAYNKGAQVGEA
ncbi:phage tail assembly protein [Actinocorallia libanotica]|uniref:Tail assembly chaperone n=1 Tax=Actinocorallia libanotica TaxID=46162 RepID=A0ABN1RXV9_9ACTN